MATTEENVQHQIECHHRKQLPSLPGIAPETPLQVLVGEQQRVQVFESLQLLNDMAEDPRNWVAHLQRFTASIATTLLYGFRTPNVNTGYVRGLMHVSFALHRSQ